MKYISIKKILLFILGLFLLSQMYYYIDLPGGRNLNKDEISFLKEVFSDKIEYEDIKIYNRKFFPDFIQDDYTAIAPNGNIYFPKNIDTRDFSVMDIEDRAWLVHEVGHVYQYQSQGQFALWKGARLWLIDREIRGLDVYAYEIRKGYELDDYNIEQQGDIFRDYFFFLHNQVVFSEEEEKFYREIIDSL